MFSISYFTLLTLNVTFSIILAKVVLSVHEEKMMPLVAALKSRTLGQKVVLQRTAAQSHCPRSQDYKSTAIKLDVTRMDEVLSLEAIESYHDSSFRGQFTAIVEVQAMISMEKLVDKLLPLGFIPAIVPEFKGITVGGSIQGLAAESTSFKFGFFHDIVTGFEILLSDGTITWCSRQENSELFYSIPGSYGTIGIITRVKLLCIDAKPYVEIELRNHNSSQSFIDFTSAVQDRYLSNPSPHALPPYDVIEGIGYKNNSIVSVSGNFVSENDLKLKYPNQHWNIRMRKCNGWGNKWFYNQVEVMNDDQLTHSLYH